MKTSRKFTIAASFAISLAFTSSSYSQYAVYDASAVVQLMHQVQAMQQALATARSQLQQAEQSLQAMTGNRGMERLLGGVIRNYLPSDWLEVGSIMQGVNPTFGGLTADVRGIAGANAVLPPSALSAFSELERGQIDAARSLAAISQAISRSALANASGRFANIQSLIQAIAGASDQKAILDLQARIGAEQGMLQNEQTKLESMYHALQAQDYAARQQQREYVIAGQGRFAERFQPVP